MSQIPLSNCIYSCSCSVMCCVFKFYCLTAACSKDVTISTNHVSVIFILSIYGLLTEFFRHGIRSPLYKPYPTDPYKSEYQKYFPGPAGELTEKGKKVMYGVGKKLKDVYGDFVGEYTEEKVHVSSTEMGRTIMTALTVMSAMFPPSKPIFKKLPNWQPIPVWQDTRDVDKAYLFNDMEFPALSLKECPKYGELIIKGNNIILNPDKDKTRNRIYEWLQLHTGDSTVESIERGYEIYDTLQFESLNGLPLPLWATQKRPYYENKPLYPDLMAPIMLSWFLNAEYLDKNEDMLSYYSGPLFNSIHEQLQTKVQKPHSHERFRFHVTHDTTLFALLWALKLSDPYTVGPGDGILFELHEKNNNPTVKVFYCETNNGYNLRELQLPLCPPPCTVDKFIESTPGLTPQQWQDKC